MVDKKIVTAVIASILAAVGASLCCVTPILAVLAGSTGMTSTFSWAEPFRPYLIALTVLFLTYAWWDKLKPKKQDIECVCEPDENGKISFWHSKRFLSLVTIFAIVMLSFPYWGYSLSRQEQSKFVALNQNNMFKAVSAPTGTTCSSCEIQKN